MVAGIRTDDILQNLIIPWKETAAMVAIRQATPEQLRRIIDVFARVTWPVPAAGIRKLHQELGWQTDPELPAWAITDLPVTSTNGQFIVLEEGDPSFPGKTAVPGGELSTVDFRIADGLTRETSSDPEARRQLKQVYQSLVQQIDDIVGFKSSPSSYGNSRMWDLANGGRIHVLLLSRAVTMKISSAWMVNVERAEAHFDQTGQPD